MPQYRSSDTFSRSTRTDWTTNFPNVFVHTAERARDEHPLYSAAKSGSGSAALSLATDLLSPLVIDELRKLIIDQPVILLPVIADEEAGFNAIPDGMAQILGDVLKLSVLVGDIVQSNKVGHTRAKAFQRIVTPAEFTGEVEDGVDYILIDDHVGLGGTLANLRGFVEMRGGRVIAMTTLTKSPGAEQISLTLSTRNTLWETHGHALDILWQTEFGHGLDCLTEREALVLCRQPSVTAIENFLAQAAVEARRRGLGAASN